MSDESIVAGFGFGWTLMALFNASMDGADRLTILNLTVILLLFIWLGVLVLKRKYPSYAGFKRAKLRC